MSTTAACPACVALPDGVGEAAVARQGAALREYHFSLPTIHCSACISAVERGMAGVTGVEAPRVNLTLKRLTLRAPDRPEVEGILLDQLKTLGYPADALDA
ncbi:MAG: heavy metal-associated domain-containing protein, partial [Pseudomonadota bacterium]